MREVNSIILHKVIVHVLDKEAKNPMLADYNQEITEEIHELLEKHIIRSLKDDDNRIAKFIAGPNIVRDNCDAMLYDESNFIEGSQKIARQLFSSMQHHGNTSSCDLVISIYSVDGMKYVAILKMDYKKSYTHTIEYLNNNKIKASIIPQEIGLPGIGQRLQKCAFIKLYEANEEYDLIVLDKQQASDQDHEVANFFVKDFLNSNLVIDNKDNTKMFRNFTEKWTRNNLRQDVVTAMKLRETLADHLIKEEEINVESFIDEIIEDNEIKKGFIDNLKNNGFNAESFEVDSAWVDKNLKKKSIMTDTGFSIKNEREHFDDNLKFQIKDNKDGTVDIIIKNVCNIIEK